MPVNKRALQMGDKILRRTSILDAAAQLFSDDNEQLPSVLQISNACGLAKGTVYLYFKTKEEIFMALVEAQIHAQLKVIQDSIENRDPPNLLIDQIVQYFNNNPSFLPLASMMKSVLEQNLERSRAEQFKARMANGLRMTGKKLEAYFPVLSGRGEQLLLRSYALVVGMWQMLNWPSSLDSLKEDEMFSSFNVEFYSEIKDALSLFWMGYLPKP